MNHYRNLRDANVLVTPAFDYAAFALQYAIEAGEIVCFYGDAGHGKTFAAETLVGEYAECDSCYLTFPGRPSPKRVAAGLATALTGVDRDLTLSQLNDVLIDRLAAKKTVVIVDEAQRLGIEALEFLRHIHDEVWRKTGRTGEGEAFTLLLVGGNGCFEALTRYPMLRSRVAAWVEFPALNEEQVVDFIRQFHPLYQDVDETLLRMIDEEAMHGNLRDWADFTHKAVSLCKRTNSPLTEEISRNAFAWRHLRDAA